MINVKFAPKSIPTPPPGLDAFAATGATGP